MRSTLLLSLVGTALACDSCYGPLTGVVHERNVRRMQPEASDATVAPKKPLEWGQVNFLHTTDTHGWLEGHLKEENYGADWGDFVSFTKQMRDQSHTLGVDLILVDTGDLHDGNGLSDAALPNGVYTNPIFDKVDYDVLTIGNHELYESEIAYEHFYNFSQAWGNKYVTSNVQILNPKNGLFEYIGSKFRYFKTAQGLRVMTFGVLFDFTGNSNVSKIIKGADLIQEKWFLDAVNYKHPIDLFLLIGHNPVDDAISGSTIGLVQRTIRAMRPTTPIQSFGGHTHIRDFKVFDDSSTGLESGRYCETLGWLSMSGIKGDNYHGNMFPKGVANPSRLATNTSKSRLVYSRRYLDWNRLTFEYHAKGSQGRTFDTKDGLKVTDQITQLRTKLNLTSLYGCAPATYCASCAPFGSPANIFSLVSVALGATVINETRATIPRYIIVNSGSIRFDLVQGPFTYDDSFIVSPFADAFQYIPSVPYKYARKVLSAINGAVLPDKRSENPNLANRYASMPLPSSPIDSCTDPDLGFASPASSELKRGVTRRSKIVTAGYTTTDAFGTDGDDTPHSAIPYFPQPNYVAGNASFPATPLGDDDPVDVIFLDYFASSVVRILNAMGGTYTIADVGFYIDSSFTTQDYLPKYAQITPSWQADVPNCPVGGGVGFA